MYDWYKLVEVCNKILDLLTGLDLYLRSVITPILYILTFALLLKIGSSCIRGYRQ